MRNICTARTAMLARMVSDQMEPLWPETTLVSRFLNSIDRISGSKGHYLFEASVIQIPKFVTDSVTNFGTITLGAARRRGAPTQPVLHNPIWAGPSAGYATSCLGRNRSPGYPRSAQRSSKENPLSVLEAPATRPVLGARRGMSIVALVGITSA